MEEQSETVIYSLQGRNKGSFKKKLDVLFEADRYACEGKFERL